MHFGLQMTAYSVDPSSLDYRLFQAINGLAGSSRMSVCRLNQRLGTVLLLLGALTAVARVYVGAHYHADVLAGAVLGCAVSAVIAALSHRPTADALLKRISVILARWRFAVIPTRQSTRSQAWR